MIYVSKSVTCEFSSYFTIYFVDSMVCSMWSTIIFATLPAIIKFLVFLYYFVVGDCVTSSSTALPKPNTHNHFTFMQIYNFLALLWTQFFISGIIQMVVASTFTTWYWTFKKSELPPVPLRAAIKATFKYHLGTIALGSLTINIFLIPRVILSILTSKVVYCRWTVSYLEKFLRQFNRNAYIICAMQGKSLCSSGSKAYELILPNFVHYFSLNLMAGIFFVISKFVLIFGAAAIICLTFDDLRAGGYTFGIIAAYLIANSFFSVYSMAVDTMTLCFRE